MTAAGKWAMYIKVVRRLLVAIIWTVALVSTGVGGQALAQGSVGTCENADLVTRFRGKQEVTLDDAIWSFALRDGTKGFALPDGTGASIELKIGTPLFIRKNGPSMLGAARIGPDETFWFRREDLLCDPPGKRGLRPLNGAGALERKVIVRTGWAIKEEGKAEETVKAYPTPEMSDCGGSECRQITRFQRLFVYAERAGALLLADRLVLDGVKNSPFVGWVKSRDVIEWPTSIGLRPREDLRDPDGKIGTICAYLSVADANAKNKCQAILGGPDWFRNEQRLLLLRETGNYYETVAPVTGQGGNTVRRDAQGDLVLVVDPVGAKGFDPGQLEAQNQIDVFFAIDGTNSMQPWINAIKGADGKDGVVQRIAKELQKRAVNGATFRYGFRIYRDTSPRGTVPLDEKLAFSGGDSECREQKDTSRQRNLEEFNTRLRQVIARDTDGDDDFAEDTMGGIDLALKDMAACPGHTKFLFVIGDAGYDQAKQESRKARVVELSQITRRLNDRKQFGRPVVYFLRTPTDPRQLKAASVSGKAYQDAYDSFAQQALDIVAQLDLQKDAPAKYVKTLGQGATADQALLDEIGNAVTGLVNPRLVQEIKIDMQNGASLMEALKRVQGNNRDIPGLFWGLMERGACDNLGEACTKGVVQGVATLFVDKRDKVEPDVFMTVSQFQMWRRFIPKIEACEQGECLRDRLTQALVTVLETLIKEPPYEDTEETLENYLSRAGGIPAGFRTPLLAYSMAELRSSDRVKICEIKALVTWLRQAGQAFEIAARGTALADFKKDGQEGCSGASAKAASIPQVTVQMRPILGGGRIDFPFGGTTAYWLPQSHLP